MVRGSCRQGRHHSRVGRVAQKNCRCTLFLICEVLHVWSKAVAGGAGVIAGQPLDTARIRMQQPGRMWTSAAACLRSTAAKEGITALCTSYPLATISFQVALSRNILSKIHSKKMGCKTEPDSPLCPALALFVQGHFVPPGHHQLIGSSQPAAIVQNHSLRQIPRWAQFGPVCSGARHTSSPLSAFR